MIARMFVCFDFGVVKMEHDVSNFKYHFSLELVHDTGAHILSPGRMISAITVPEPTNNVHVKS